MPVKKSVNKKKDVFHELKREMVSIREEIRTDISVPIVASFGFIIALVWRDAIRSLIEEFILRAGILKNVWIYELFSAIILTTIILIIMLSINRFNNQKKKERIEKIIKKHK